MGGVGRAVERQVVVRSLRAPPGFDPLASRSSLLLLRGRGRRRRRRLWSRSVLPPTPRPAASRPFAAILYETSASSLLWQRAPAASPGGAGCWTGSVRRLICSRTSRAWCRQTPPLSCRAQKAGRAVLCIRWSPLGYLVPTGVVDLPGLEQAPGARELLCSPRAAPGTPRVRVSRLARSLPLTWRVKSARGACRFFLGWTLSVPLFSLARVFAAIPSPGLVVALLPSPNGGNRPPPGAQRAESHREAGVLSAPGR